MRKSSRARFPNEHGVGTAKQYRTFMSKKYLRKQILSCEATVLRMNARYVEVIVGEARHSETRQSEISE